MTNTPYDSLILISFGGPNGPDDVMPFLENVVRGRNVPRERLLDVSEHYMHYGGVSPINEQNEELIETLRADFKAHDIDLPIYWGNRNWKPYITDALGEMKRDGKKRALAFFTSMFSCYSGCRQYRENIMKAQEEVGEGAPIVEKVRMGFNHPKFISAMKSRVEAALAEFEEPTSAELIFTAHSIPLAMAKNASYEMQLKESSRLVAEAVGREDFHLTFQSRSGPPQVPWLEPDICDYIEQLAAKDVKNIVIIPIGFVSDHMEVMYDLDDEAKEVSDKHGMKMVRAGTAGTHPDFIAMIRELVIERMTASKERPAVGNLGPWHDVCPVDCCKVERPAGGGRPSGSGGRPPAQAA